MDTATKAGSRREIRAVIDEWAKATRELNAGDIMALCAPGMQAFECHSRFGLLDSAAYRDNLEACFPHMRAPMKVELHDVTVEVEGHLGFSHHVLHCVATGSDGAEHPSWLRATTCFRRMGGQWKVVHTHCSAPFNPYDGLAMLDGKDVTGSAECV